MKYPNRIAERKELDRRIRTVKEVRSHFVRNPRNRVDTLNEKIHEKLVQKSVPPDILTEVISIEETLGINPQGLCKDVTKRLDDIEQTLRFLAARVKDLELRQS